MNTRFIKRALCAAMTAAMLIMCSVTAFAAGDITVNGTAVSAGDTVTFEYYMSGVEDPLEAAGAVITYDSKSLEYVDGSIGFDVFKNAMYNIEDGKIQYSAIDVLSGFDVKDEKLIVKLSFKVLDGAKGDLEITNTFGEIFTMTNEAEDLTEDDYKARTALSVNTYTKNDAPSPGIDGNRLDEYENSSDTDFDALMLGTDKDEVIASNNASSAASSTESITESTATASSGETGANESASETASVTSSSSEKTTNTDSSAVSSAIEEKKTDNKTIVILIAAAFVILLIGAVVLAIKAKSGSDKSE